MIKKTRWLVKEAKLRVRYMTNRDCIFCKIVKGELESKPLLETENVLAINDINPVSDVHVLIIPKNHIESVLSIREEDGPVVVAMFDVGKRLVTKKGLAAFRFAFNGGRYQHVPHLHMHLLAGGSVKWSRL